MTSPSLLDAARRFYGCKDPEGFVCRDNSHSKECWRKTAEQDKQLWACESLAAWASSMVEAERERCAKHIWEKFSEGRFNKMHMALGDIRLTIGEQEEIVESLRPTPSKGERA